MIYSITVKAPQQYRLHAYICGPGCVRWADSLGTVSFDWIYLNRPTECRYAIAGKWSLAKHGEEVVVWDLFDATRTMVKGHWKLHPPKPKFEVDDLDAAVMATSMLYDAEDEE